MHRDRLAVLFSIVNLVVGSIVRFLALPLIVLTLGLFLLVVNAGLLALTAGLSSHLDIDNFGAAFFGALIISVFGCLADLVLPLTERE